MSQAEARCQESHPDLAGGARAQRLWSFFTAILGDLSGSCVGSGIAGPESATTLDADVPGSGFTQYTTMPLPTPVLFFLLTPLRSPVPFQLNTASARLAQSFSYKNVQQHLIN